MTRAALLLASLLAALALAWFASVPPAPRGVDAPAFSATRALADVRAIAERPHPAGSADHARVRALLLARMQALGLEVRVQADRGVRIQPDSLSGADLQNLIGVLPGRDRAQPVLAIMAHYDSVPGSPGAADDAAGVATALEVVRALCEAGPPARDVAVILTDAEENGLLGAHAFFERDPLARRIGALINMDTRGDAGRAIMYETGPGSGGLVRLYGVHATRPTADSIASFVRRLIRNNSDFAVAADHGVAGLNFAFLGDQFDYHAASSTADALDAGTLQHLGDQVWAVVQPLATGAALPARAEDPVYASLLGLMLVAYPAWGGWLVLLAGVVVARLAWRRDPVSPGAIARGLLAALLLLVAGALALHLARVATGAPFGFTTVRPLLARWDVFEAACGFAALAVAAGVAAADGRRRLAALTPLVAGVIAGVLAVSVGRAPWLGPVLGLVAAGLAAVAFAKPLTRRAMSFGLFGLVLLIALAAQIFAPSAAVIPAWALLGGALVLLLARWPVAQAMVAALIVGQILATAHLILLTVGENLPEVIALYLLLAALPLWPTLGIPRPGWLAIAAGVAALVLLALIRFGDPYSPARPRTSQAIYLADADGRFLRITSLAYPDRWTLDTLAADGGTVRKAVLPPVYEQAFVADARPTAIARPQVIVAGNRLTIAPPPGAREVRLALEGDAPLAGVAVNGFATHLLGKDQRKATIAWFAPAAPIVIDFAGAARIEGHLSTLRDGWPAGARPLPPRPANVMPWYNDGATLTIDRLGLVTR